MITIILTIILEMNNPSKQEDHMNKLIEYDIVGDYSLTKNHDEQIIAGSPGFNVQKSNWCSKRNKQ